MNITHIPHMELELAAEIKLEKARVIELDIEFKARQQQVADDSSFAEDWYLEKESLEGELRRTQLYLKKLYVQYHALVPRVGDRRSTCRGGKDKKKKLARENGLDLGKIQE